MAAGAPEGIIGWIDPQPGATNAVMQNADLILATGGLNGQGGLISWQARPWASPRQHPVVIDTSPTSKWRSAPSSTLRPLTTARLQPASSPSPSSPHLRRAVKEEFAARGAYFLGATGWTRCGALFSSTALNAKIVNAYRRRLAGVEVPGGRLIGDREHRPLEPFAHEKLSTVLSMYKAADFRRGPRGGASGG